jgi:hypothetical protein
MTAKVVRIGGASGFWGDSPEGARQLILSGECDYVVFDYLAEITMSLLGRAMAKDPAAGYAPDFVRVVVASYGREIAERKIRLVSSAGGVNPLACKAALEAELKSQGLDLTVAAVIGDDVMPYMEALRPDLHEMRSGAKLPEKVATANAYIGARAIARALDCGADIVVTGRAADSALTLGILMHEFRWSDQDFDLIAAGSLAGHVIECGPQSTGGVFTDWREVADGWHNIGYPIAECRADGVFVVTKPKDTGGKVSFATVAEQICYETSDPSNYVLPDVVCDLSNISIEQAGPDRISVSGVRGKAPTSTYKVSATYQDGYRSIATLFITGHEAVERGRATAEAILKKVERIILREGLGPFDDTSYEVLGGEHTYGPNAAQVATREVVVKIAVRHKNRKAVDIFAGEIAPATTSMAQGSAGIMGGRPKVQPVLRLYSFLLDKSRLGIQVTVGDRPLEEVEVITEGQATPSPTPDAPVEARYPEGRTATVPLQRLAWGRSGDKGDDSNIAIIARRPEFLDILRDQLTASVVKDYMGHIVAGDVLRFSWPGVNGFNFLLQESLGGGGVASLRYDPQGKAHAQMLLSYPIRVPQDWVEKGLVAA